MKEFERFVLEHSILPSDDQYNTVALCGESGEVANVIKKIQIRNNLNSKEVISMKTMDDYKNNLKEELGDVLFYKNFVKENQLIFSHLDEFNI